jgi:hypothetical protein
MGIFVIVVFWAAIVRLWMVDGPKIPLVFIVLWLAGFFGLPLLGISGLFFLAFEAIMAAILLIIAQYKASL